MKRKIILLRHTPPDLDEDETGIFLGYDRVKWSDENRTKKGKFVVGVAVDDERVVVVDMNNEVWPPYPGYYEDELPERDEPWKGDVAPVTKAKRGDIICVRLYHLMPSGRTVDSAREAGETDMEDLTDYFNIAVYGTARMSTACFVSICSTARLSNMIGYAL